MCDGPVSALVAIAKSALGHLAHLGHWLLEVPWGPAPP